MAELKTKETNASVPAFIRGLADETQRRDSQELVKLMKAATGKAPKMWGEAIVGFGKLPLKYASGRELEWPIIGFAPRKGTLSLYLTCDISQFAKQLKQLGKHKTGKGCLYIKALDDIDRDVLRKLVHAAVAEALRITAPKKS